MFKNKNKICSIYPLYKTFKIKFRAYAWLRGEEEDEWNEPWGHGPGWEQGWIQAHAPHSVAAESLPQRWTPYLKLAKQTTPTDK